MRLFGQVGRERTVVIIVVSAAVGLALTDLLFSSVSAFWGGHTMASAIISGILVVLLTAFVIDQVLKFREAQRWRSPGALAIRDITQAGIGFLEYIQMEAFSEVLSLAPGEELFDFGESDFESVRSHSGDGPFVDSLDGLQDKRHDLLGRVNRWSALLVGNEILHGAFEATNLLEERVSSFVREIEMVPGFDADMIPQSWGEVHDPVKEAALSAVGIVRACERLDEESARLGGSRTFHQYTSGFLIVEL
jgi:hypothetical protein